MNRPSRRGAPRRARAPRGSGNRRPTLVRESKGDHSFLAGESTRLLDQVAQTLPEGVGFLASASAIGWYGDRGTRCSTRPLCAETVFWPTCATSGKDATSTLESRGTPVAHFRSGIVLSTRGGALKKQLPLFRFGLGGTLGSGLQWMSPIALIDEVRAILWIIDQPVDGSPQSRGTHAGTNRDFTNELASALHRRAFLSVPASALRAALGREMANELVLVSQRVTPQRLLASGFEFPVS
jgi:uncharacterized protein (TIGR01777 family)